MNIYLHTLYDLLIAHIEIPFTSVVLYLFKSENNLTTKLMFWYLFVHNVHFTLLYIRIILIKFDKITSIWEIQQLLIYLNLIKLLNKQNISIFSWCHFFLLTLFECLYVCKMYESNKKYQQFIYNFLSHALARLSWSLGKKQVHRWWKLMTHKKFLYFPLFCRSCSSFALYWLYTYLDIIMWCNPTWQRE